MMRAHANPIRTQEAPATEPVRVLHVIQTLDPATGGPAEAVRSLVLYGKPEYVGEVVTQDPPDAGFLQEFAFPVHALGPGKGSYGYSPRLKNWLEQNGERFDGVLVHGLWRYCGQAVREVFRGWKPYAVYAHGMLDPYFKQNFPLKHLKKWAYWLTSEYWTLRAADRVLFTTDEEERLAQKSFFLHQWRGLVAPLGAPEPLSDSDTVRSAFAKCCPEVSDKSFLLFLGRIHKKKGCDLLIEAFAEVASRDERLHLVIAGPDQQNWRAALEKKTDELGIRRRVHWPGMLTGDAKWGALYACDAFVLPSHQENFGIAVAEALGCGRPVLLSDKVNISDQIVRDGAGFMESDTLAGTQRLLDRWLALTAAERTSMGTRARRCFEQRYELRRNAHKALAVFGRRTGASERLPADRASQPPELVGRP